MGWSTVVFENRATPSRLPGKTALLHPASLGKPRYSIPPLGKPRYSIPPLLGKPRYSIPPPWENRATPSRLWGNRATPSRLPGKTALLHPASGETALLHPASLGKPRYSVPPTWENRTHPASGKTVLLLPASDLPSHPKSCEKQGSHSHTVLLHSSLNVLLQR